MTLRRPHAALAALAVLVLVVLAYLGTCVRRSPRTVATYHVSQVDGADSRTCEQAKSAATPRASVNGGVGCLAGGDVLMIAPGLYAEWLVTQMNSAGTVEQRYLDVQPGTQSIKNGRSASQPTRLVAGEGGKVTLSPTTKNPETGVIIGSVGSFARFISFEGLHLTKAGGRDERTQAAGIYFADSQDLTFRLGSVYRGTIKASGASQRLTIEGTEVSYSGEGCDFKAGDPNTGGQPCPHGMYVCGTDHVIQSNYVHDFAHTGIQLSCEKSNSTALIHGNRIAVGPGPGISAKGAGQISSNVIEGAGVGIRWYGGFTVANNTIIDYYRNNAWVPDPYGLVYDGGGTGTNNLIYRQKSAWNQIINQQFKPIDPYAIHTNMCDQSGNAGCTNVQAPEAVFVDMAARNYTLRTDSAAQGQGVVHQTVTRDIRRQPYATPPALGAYAYAHAPVPVVDTTPPTVRLTNPPTNEQVFGTALPLVATASDNVGVVQVQFAVGSVAVGEVSSPPYQVLWDTTSVPNGNHSVRAVATDGAGNSATATSTLRVANPLPPEPPGQPVLACEGTIVGSAFSLTCTKP